MSAGAATVDNVNASKPRLWTGRILSAISALFLAFDAIVKIIKTTQVTTSMVQLGYPDVARALGAVLLGCVILYVIPRTAVLGAILLTGYLGGAVATNVRVGSPLLGYILLPVYVALMVWGGLYLRDERVRGLVPLRSNT